MDCRILIFSPALAHRSRIWHLGLPASESLSALLGWKRLPWHRRASPSATLDKNRGKDCGGFSAGQEVFVFSFWRRIFTATNLLINVA